MALPYLPDSGKNFMLQFLPTTLRDTGSYWGHNVPDARTPEQGFSMKSVKAAQDAGYSDRQIKTALQQYQQWKGQDFMGPSVYDFRKTSPATHQDLHFYQGTGGGIGMKVWDAAMAAGVSPEDLRKSSGQAGQTWGYRAEDAYQDWKQSQYVAEDEKRWEDRIADVPTIEDLAAAMPEPKIRAGRDYATSGRSAQGMRIKKGTKFAEGGKRGTKGYFGRGAKFTGTTAPSMNIGGTSNQGGSQANNTLNTA